MAFKCGHCGEKHDKAEEALKCAASKYGKKKEQHHPVRALDAATPDFIEKALELQTEHMRPGAQKFLSDLLRQFGLVLTNDMTTETIPWQDGKKILHGLIDARRLKSSSKPYSLPDGVLHDPPAGLPA
jgi:hypothetical protein